MRQEGQTFQIILSYTASSRSVWVRDLVSGKKKKRKKKNPRTSFSKEMEVKGVISPPPQKKAFPTVSLQEL